VAADCRVALAKAEFVWEYSFGRGTVFLWGRKPNSIGDIKFWSWDCMFMGVQARFFVVADDRPSSIFKPRHDPLFNLPYTQLEGL